MSPHLLTKDLPADPIMATHPYLWFPSAHVGPRVCVAMSTGTRATRTQTLASCTTPAIPSHWLFLTLHPHCIPCSACRWRSTASSRRPNWPAPTHTRYAFSHGPDSRPFPTAFASTLIWPTNKLGKPHHRQANPTATSHRAR